MEVSMHIHKEKLTLPDIWNKHFITYFCQTLNLLVEETDKNANCFQRTGFALPSQKPKAKSQSANKYHLDFLATLKLEYDILNGTPAHKAQDDGLRLLLGVCYKGSTRALIAIMERIPRHMERNCI